jgi:hypothetical protein
MTERPDSNHSENVSENGSSSPIALSAEPDEAFAWTPSKSDRQISVDGQAWDFAATGAWWQRPALQRLALLTFVRPLYWLSGLAAMAHQAISLRAPYFPYGRASGHQRAYDNPQAFRSRLAKWFSPLAYVHEYPCQDPWLHRHDEDHDGGDGCSAGPHGLCWVHKLEYAYTVGDTFDLRFDRTYRLIYSDEGKSNMGSKAERSGAPTDEVASIAQGTRSEAPGASRGQDMATCAINNERS